MPPRPLYQRIKDHIVHHIDAGAWRPGDQVPPESALVREMGASRMTVNRAIRELVQEGLLMRVQGSGTFVVEPRVPADLVELRNIAEEIRETGRAHSARLISLAAESASESVAATMELAPGARVFHSVILHLADDTPVQLEARYVNPACAPDYMDLDFAAVTPNQYLMEAAPLSEVEHVVEAVLPEADVRALLEIRAGEPCLRLHRRTWSRGRVASSATLTYPGTAHRFSTRFTYRDSRGRGPAPIQQRHTNGGGTP